jgi:hypothetical protein
MDIPFSSSILLFECIGGEVLDMACAHRARLGDFDRLDGVWWNRDFNSRSTILVTFVSALLLLQ